MALSALILNALLAGPRPWLVRLGVLAWWQRPLSWARTLERKLNREHRSPQERRYRGFVLAFMAGFAALLAGLLLDALLAQAPFLEVLLLAGLISVRPIWDIASQVKRGLAMRDMMVARAAFAGTPVKHHALLDEFGLGRAAVEWLAVGCMSRMISPLLWYLALGLPGALISLSATLLDEAASSDDAFSSAIRRYGEIVHFLPARVAALLWLMASLFLPSRTTPPQAWRLPVSVLAWRPMMLGSAAATLRLSLGGPSSAFHREWLGNGSPKPVAADVQRARYLFALLHLLFLVALGLLV